MYLGYMVAELSNTARWIIGITFWLSLILYTGSKFEDVATNGRCLPEIQSKITWKYSARVEIPTCASMSVIIRFTNIYSDSYLRLRSYFLIVCWIKLWSRIRAQLCRYIKYLKSLGSYVFVEGLGKCFFGVRSIEPKFKLENTWRLATWQKNVSYF